MRDWPAPHSALQRLPHAVPVPADQARRLEQHLKATSAHPSQVRVRALSQGRRAEALRAVVLVAR